MPVPPAGWQVPRPQPWFPQPPTVSMAPPTPAGYVQQPLFPVQNVRPPLITSTSSQIIPPGLPSSTLSVPVSQPLFPVVSNNLPQSLPYSTPLSSINVPSSNLTEGSVAVHSGANNSLTTLYHTPGASGLNWCSLWTNINLNFQYIFSLILASFTKQKVYKVLGFFHRIKLVY